jgi:DNA-binding response OmpR family regulator
MHVLLVEPDDDFCLFLRQAITSAGCRVTITGAFDEARDVMERAESVDFLVANAALPDGSGLVLALDAAAAGKQVVILRRKQDQIILSDRDGTICRGDGAAIAAFLEKTLAEMRHGRAARTLRGRRLASPVEGGNDK